MRVLWSGLAAMLLACSPGAPTTAWATRASTDEVRERPAGEPGADADRVACVALDDSRPRDAVTLEGSLSVDEAFLAPNGARTRPYVLRVEAPPCTLTGADMREIHLAPVEGVELGRWVGRRVRVTGAATAASSGWDARSVVVLTSDARPVS